MEDDDPWAARAGWSLTSGRVAKNPDGLDLPALWTVSSPTWGVVLRKSSGR